MVSANDITKRVNKFTHIMKENNCKSHSVKRLVSGTYKGLSQFDNEKTNFKIGKRFE